MEALNQKQQINEEKDILIEKKNETNAPLNDDQLEAVSGGYKPRIISDDGDGSGDDAGT